MSEIVIGTIMVLVMIYNIWFKIQSRTLVFILNPCNISAFFLIYLCFTEFNQVGELVAFCHFGFCFGGFIGIIFSENEGLPMIWCIVYTI
jgi:hypothetical protein